MYTHFMYNTLAVNPAYAGSRDALTFSALHRSQWLGFEGAPTTQSATMHAPIKKKHIGLGISLVNDQIGNVSATTAFADLSYRVKLAKKTWLAFGLKAGTNFRRTDFSNINLDNPADPDFLNTAQNIWLPNFGAGAYLYSKKYYAGISVPKILKDGTFILPSSAQNFYDEAKHIYLIGGYIHKIRRTWKIKPAGLVKVTPSAPIQFDLSLQAIYKDRFWLGAMTRTGDSFGALFGVFLSRSLEIGYAYDWSYANRTFKYNYGSHEVMLQFTFDLRDDYVCPAYF